MPAPDNVWLAATLQSIGSYRRMIDAAVAQLSDAELDLVPTNGANSVAVLLRHLGGNLQSRWTDFLESDGEKPTRDRDAEFQNWQGDRESLLEYFDAGWQQMIQSISSLEQEDLHKTVLIRGESHSIPQAIVRSVTHVAYHAGQIMMVARTVHQGPWHWLTIPPGESQRHNQSTWGTARSRGIAGEE